MRLQESGMRVTQGAMTGVTHTGDLHLLAREKSTLMLQWVKELHAWEWLCGIVGGDVVMVAWKNVQTATSPLLAKEKALLFGMRLADKLKWRSTASR